MKALRRLTIVSTIVLFILAFAPGARAVLNVDELSGNFGVIELDLGDESWFGLTQGAVSQPAAGGSLEILDIGVDLTGYNVNGGSVLGDGSTVTIANVIKGTSAVFDVTSASLTQIEPLAIGYMELVLTQKDGSDLTTDADELIVLPSMMQMSITYNGLIVETDGSDGTASIIGFGSASFSASPIPEPASLALFLGGFIFLRRRKKQVSVR